MYPNKTLVITEEMAQVNCEELQKPYDLIVDNHVMDLKQHGMPEGKAAAPMLLAFLATEMYPAAIPMFEILECSLVALDLVTRSRTHVTPIEKTKDADLDALFYSELQYLSAFTDIQQCVIDANNVAFHTAVDRAREQLDFIYMLLGIDRTDILRQGLIRRKGAGMTKPELAKHKQHVEGIPALAVENAYRKAEADRLKLYLANLDSYNPVARAFSLRTLIEAVTRDALSEATKTLEMLEFNFATICKILDASVAPLTQDEIKAKGPNLLIGEWVQLDPIPNIFKYVKNKIVAGEDYHGALSILRVMLDLGRHIAGLPRATVLQTGLGLRGESSPEEEKKANKTH